MFATKNEAFHASANVVPPKTVARNTLDDSFAHLAKPNKAGRAPALSRQERETRLLSQWLDLDHCSTIDDYNGQEDEIVLVYDPHHHPKPLISLDHSESPLWAKVLIDGLEIAKVNMPLTLANIRLLPI